MAEVEFSGKVAPEVQAICDDLEKAVIDIKAKAGSTVEIGDGLKIVMDAGSQYAALPADVKTKDSFAYFGLTLGKVVADFLGYV